MTVKVTIESKDGNARGFSDFTELVPAVGRLNKESITYTIDQQSPCKTHREGLGNTGTSQPHQI